MTERFSLVSNLAIKLLAVAFFLVSNSSAAASNLDNNSQTMRSLSRMPLAFTANQGQWDEQIKFRANAGGATIFNRTVQSEDSDPISIVDKRYGMMPDRQPKTVETMMIKANFISANSNLIIVGLDMMEYKCNYFIGNDPKQWHTDVPNYQAVVYKEIYEGIDLKYYGNGKQMEYDFIVSPGADFSQIKIQYEGAESIAINANGELVVTTKWGEVVEQRPVIYQLENNIRIAVEGEYRLRGTSSFGFELSGYNPALLLVIDPVLSYSTYLGGGGLDIGNGIAVDETGAVYVTGYTNSSNFPTFNPYTGTYQGSTEVFISKLSSSGNSLIFSTYLGGVLSGVDQGRGIAVDRTGAVYVTGRTNSIDFPTFNPYQQTYQGSDDAFITKLSSSGNSLIYSTYLGGTNSDAGSGIEVDESGEAYVTGHTSSTDFPTLNPYQGTHQGSNDVFVTKLSISGNSLIYSTYLGGSDNDFANGIAVDANGAVHVTGTTRSTNFPTTGDYQVRIRTYKIRFDHHSFNSLRLSIRHHSISFVYNRNGIRIF